MKTRKIRKVSAITLPRWTGYAAAATAAGFVAAPAAEAEIHYSGLINQHVAGRHDVTIPLDPAGASFVAGHNNYVAGSSSFSAGGVAFLDFTAAQSASIAGATGCSEDTVCASNLKRGDAISVRAFAPGLGVLAYDDYFNFWNSFGAFRYRGFGIAGFKFNNGAGVQYGWVRVKMMGPRRNNYSVFDFAYGDPGERVFAGQKSSSESTPSQKSAPSLESLGGLALGAAGLLAWRRQKRTVAG